MRLTDGGIEYEPDQRHAEITIDSMGVQSGRPVPSPGAKESEGEDGAEEELERNGAGLFRGLPARLNYIALE